ncbi:hypothetical protein [Shewanella putrefaciens]|uniref:Uncharacterized protein n=1 Tax=Shewanella putrefaciens (strain 200) TaxID=399804 RepID=E6XPV5_SHEP2|nr:hypothetical protein [Shewanella putrefaciens]MDR6962237.1 hypothetical protein [Shewanella putrefaciens]SUI82680.1 Uncharacterised protein [Shewanella putrefaciens]
MKVESLPSNYTAPEKMLIGSNSLNNVKVLIDFNGFTPILIGDGEIPHIWIYVPMNQQGTEWYPLVKDNFSTNPSVIVIKRDNGVKVTTPDGIVIDCEKRGDGIVVVNKLNLKPFGINVTANSESLSIMNATFSSSGFSNMRAMVGLGGA